MSVAPWCSTSVPSGRRPRRMVEGFGSAVLPQPYQQQATPTPRRATGSAALAAAASASARAPGRRAAPRGSRRCRRPRSTWPVAVASPSRSAFSEAELQRGRCRPRRPAGRSASPARSPPAARRSRGRRRRPGCGCASRGRGRGRAARGRGRWRAPAPGWRPSGPSSHRRRCRRRPRSRARSAGRRRRSRAAAAMRAGWRLVVAAINSGRVKVMRTGRPVRSAARPSSGCTDRSSLAPKPPPTAEGMMRTRSGGRPSSGGGVVAVHVGRLGAGADHQRRRPRARRRPPRARCRRARRRRCELGRRHVRRAAPARPRRRRGAPGPRSGGCRGGRGGPAAASAATRLGGSASARQRGPGDREAGEVAGGVGVLEGDQRHRLAAEARLGLGERRLVGEGAGSRRSGCGRGCRRR